MCGRGWKQEKDERDSMTRMLDLLKRQGPLQFGDLRQKLGVSSKTLSSYIKQCEADDKIEDFRIRGEDRRKQWYRIKPESLNRVEAIVAAKEVEDFIASISNRVYEFKLDGARGTAVFLSSATRSREETQKNAKNIAKQSNRALRFIEPYVKGEKIAVVLMMGRKESEAKNHE